MSVALQRLDPNFAALRRRHIRIRLLPGFLLRVLLLGVLAAISQLPAAIYEVAVLALLHGDGVVDVAFQDDGFGSWTSSQGRITPRNPNLPMPPPESGPPLGIFSGKPMPPWTTPLPLEQLLNKSNASGDGNWFARLAGAILADVSGNIRSSMAEPQNSQGSALRSPGLCSAVARSVTALDAVRLRSLGSNYAMRCFSEYWRRSVVV